ncbi:unnamed protein product [Periconia digitata]|uniref:Uncharacterized protein n=1 Tax=Periconia digitata TaxID=1303443 RepID=A0A9W4UV14_9PLEO|nr:unnamed protein product [Periconia digitata]
MTAYMSMCVSVYAACPSLANFVSGKCGTLLVSMFRAFFFLGDAFLMLLFPYSLLSCCTRGALHVPQSSPHVCAEDMVGSQAVFLAVAVWQVAVNKWPTLHCSALAEPQVAYANIQ